MFVCACPSTLRARLAQRDNAPWLLLLLLLARGRLARAAAAATALRFARAARRPLVICRVKVSVFPRHRVAHSFVHLARTSAGCGRTGTRVHEQQHEHENAACESHDNWRARPHRVCSMCSRATTSQNRNSRESVLLCVLMRLFAAIAAVAVAVDCFTARLLVVGGSMAHFRSLVCSLAR